MKSFLLSILIISIFSYDPGSWKPGKTDSKGDLIIVELENNKNLRDRPVHEIITVDMTWSILIRYDDNIQSKYYIFNNKTKKIFYTTSFKSFIKEIEKIPDGTTVRNIEKCTIPFSYMLPEEQTGMINEMMKKKNCSLEKKIMYCYCGAEKIKFWF